MTGEFSFDHFQSPNATNQPSGRHRANRVKDNGQLATLFLRVCLICILALATTIAARAGELAELFPKLPAAVFAKWAGENPSPLSDPANRTRLLAAKPDTRRAVASQLKLREFVVDEKNGFLSVGSDTDGEGAVFTMTLWKCADGSELAAAVIERWSNVTNDTSHISFWRARNGRLTDVTKDILPDLTIANFYDGHAAKLKAASADGFRWWWKLPKSGTTIRIEAPSLENLDEYADLAKPDHAYEGRWDGKAFHWVKVKAKR